MFLYTEEQLRQSYLEFMMALYLVNSGLNFHLEFPELEEFRPIYESENDEVS